MASGHDYVRQANGNQPKRRAAIAALHAAGPAPAGATCCHGERRDGRQRHGQIRVCPAAPRWPANWARVAGCVVVVETGAGPHATTQHTRCYPTSLANRPAADFAAGIRANGAHRP